MRGVCARCSIIMFRWRHRSRKYSALLTPLRFRIISTSSGLNAVARPIKAFRPSTASLARAPG